MHTKPGLFAKDNGFVCWMSDHGELKICDGNLVLNYRGSSKYMRIQVMRILLMRLFKSSTYASFQGKYSTYAEFIIKELVLTAAKFKTLVCLINHSS